VHSFTVPIFIKDLLILVAVAVKVSAFAEQRVHVRVELAFDVGRAGWRDPARLDDG